MRRTGKLFIILGIYKLIHAIGYLFYLSSLQVHFQDINFLPSNFDTSMIEPLKTGYTQIYWGNLFFSTIEVLIFLVLGYQLMILFRRSNLEYMPRNSVKFIISAILLLIIAFLVESLVKQRYFDRLQHLYDLSGDEYEAYYTQIYQQHERGIFLVNVLRYSSLFVFLFAFIYMQDYFYELNQEIHYIRIGEAIRKLDYVKLGAILLLVSGLIALVPWAGILMILFIATLNMFFELFMVYGFITCGKSFINNNSYNEKVSKYRIGPFNIKPDYQETHQNS